MSDHNKKRIVMDGVTYGSIRAAGRAMAEMHGLNPETCACEISKATREGGGYVRGHEIVRVPDSADVCRKAPRRVSDEFVRELNEQCVELIRATRGLWCTMGDTCMVHGARIGYCKRAYQLAVEKDYGSGAR